ncbi:MAG TPA: integrase arm-type DNA-binding domain-containing protein [Caldimonas sp.]|jgi:integrase
MSLSDAAIRNAKPGAKTVRMFDGGGLYLELAPSGGKWWRLKYRHGNKEKRLSLGIYPDVGLKVARARRDEARKQIAEGVDPSAARQETKHAMRRDALSTLEAVSRAWLAHRASGWSPGTLEAIKASLENHVFPAIGARPIRAIVARDIKQVVQAIDKQGAGETAGRLFQRLRSIYRYALSEDLVETDPTYPLKPAEILRPRDVTHRLALSEVDMPVFFGRLDAYEGDPSTKAALELLILTAVRPGELRGARWKEIDYSRSVWRIPAVRMKMAAEHLVPLSIQARTVLESIKCVSGGHELVFPSPFYPGKSLSDGTLNSALARLGYKGIATAHGFRTLFSMCANEAGWNSDVIEKQLSHDERDEVRGAYNRAQWLPERVKLMQWWANHLQTFRHLDAPSSKARVRIPSRKAVVSRLSARAR